MLNNYPSNLHRAIVDGDIEKVKSLMENLNFNINMELPNNYSPLTLAAISGHFDIVVLFVQCPGIDINMVPPHNLSSLDSAVCINRLDIIHYLLQNGAYKLDIGIFEQSPHPHLFDNALNLCITYFQQTN